MSFDFSSRQAPVPESVLESIKGGLRASCANASCPGLSRDPHCECYAEFAARYWMRLGSFPPRPVDLADDKWQVGDPEASTSVGRFICKPDVALAAGWSLLIFGGRSSGKTALAVRLAKSLMKWQLVHQYTPDTRAIYFTAPDFVSWLRKVEDFRSSADATEYMRGAQSGSVLVFDDVTPGLASDSRLMAVVRDRASKNLVTIIVLAQSASCYAGGLLFEYLDVDAAGNARAACYRSVELTGRILEKSGW